MSDTKHATITIKTGIDKENQKWLNWVGNYTYGSISSYNEVQINFMLDKCMFINNYFFFEQGISYDMTILKEDFKVDQKHFANPKRDGQFSKPEWCECTYRFDLDDDNETESNEETVEENQDKKSKEVEWPRLIDLFKPVSQDECQRDFLKEPQYNNDESKYSLKQCFQQKYRYMFRHTYEDSNIDAPYHLDSDLDTEERFEKLKNMPDSELYMKGTSHEFIFAHDKDALGKIQAEIDHVQSVWFELCKK